MVNDINVIKNIGILFETEIILYGAGYYGAYLEDLLDMAGVRVSYICDSYKCDEKIGCSQVISIEELKNITEQKECIIIITTMKYAEEILDNLANSEIRSKDIYSFAGVMYAIGLNLDVFSREFRRYFSLKKNTYLQKQEISNLGGRIFDINRYFFNNQIPGVLVFQPAKVGSATIYATLKNNNIPVIHFHSFEDDVFLSMVKNDLQQTEAEIKIITLVRDPIARAVSMYMHLFTNFYLDSQLLEADVMQGLYKYLDNPEQQLYNEEFQWFDRIKEFSGIDIYKYPFDEKRGWSVIEKEKWKILILKMEKMNENELILGKFVNHSNLKLVNGNMGEEKNYRFLYSDVKQKLKLPQSMIDKYYQNNEHMDHFYLPEEKEEFERKWKG